jgi:hypothetical protein
MAGDRSGARTAGRSRETGTGSRGPKPGGQEAARGAGRVNGGQAAGNGSRGN